MLLILLFFLTISSISALLPETNTRNLSEISYEINGFIIAFKNGSIERLAGTQFVPPSTDPSTGVQSKDVVTAQEFNVSARIFLPKMMNPLNPTRIKLPLLVYFHGGAFCTGSPFSPLYHKYLNSLVAEAKVVGVSVNYRLAPENPLPIGYEDARTALKWVFSHVDGNGEEAWLKEYADFGRVYLGGDSAGGNIAHNTAMRIGSDYTMGGVVLEGMFLNCPHFWGKNPIGNEAANVEEEARMESIWVHAYPDSPGFDDPLVNPAMDPNLDKLGCKRVLVYVAEKDILKDRGWYYKEALDESKWGGVVDVVEVKGEGHVFNIRRPEDPKSIAMMKNLSCFLNDGTYGQRVSTTGPAPVSIAVAKTMKSIFYSLIMRLLVYLLFSYKMPTYVCLRL